MINTHFCSSLRMESNYKLMYNTIYWFPVKNIPRLYITAANGYLQNNSECDIQKNNLKMMSFSAVISYCYLQYCGTFFSK